MAAGPPSYVTRTNAASPRHTRIGEHAAMAYDEDLANRIRELIAGEDGVTEQRMFGGLAFLIGGNMSVAASGQGGLMLRVDPGETDALLAKPHARPFEMRGRPMQGWLRVDAEGVRTKRQLEPWVRRGVAYAQSLPAKR
jgi:TfoX/Sxy family transcriptional regulator of competence genes